MLFLCLISCPAQPTLCITDALCSCIWQNRGLAYLLQGLWIAGAGMEGWSRYPTQQSQRLWWSEAEMNPTCIWWNWGVKQAVLMLWLIFVLIHRSEITASWSLNSHLFILTQILLSNSFINITFLFNAYLIVKVTFIVSTLVGVNQMEKQWIFVVFLFSNEAHWIWWKEEEAEGSS